MPLPTRRPRILLWDIETTPMIVTTWGLFKPHLDHANIRQESFIISGAWKWAEEDEVNAVSINIRNPKNDRPVISALHKVLSMADVLVGHNGDKFDLRKFNARAIYHNLRPLPPIPTVDTLKVARKLFYFNSNRLDYLGKFLCGTGKIPTNYDLWMKIMDKDAEALEKMVKYNKVDVLVLEKVYKRLRPYMRNHPNTALYRDAVCCAACGSEKYEKRGFHYLIATRRQRYRCNECGAWWSGPVGKEDR